MGGVSDFPNKYDSVECPKGARQKKKLAFLAGYSSKALTPPSPS